MKSAPCLFLVCALVAGCGEESAAPTPLGSEDIVGYRNWPLRRLAVSNSGGHGVSNVYANDVVSNYLGKVAPGGVTDPAILRYPVGALIVKDVFKPDGSLKYVAIMRKPETIPPAAVAHGGWVWSQRNTSTEGDQFKGADECLDCHNQANQERFKDYVFVFP